MSLSRFFLVVFLTFYFIPGFSQEKFNDKFNDANLLMEEKLYTIALPLWLEILQTDTASSNWNYKVGICYLNSGFERTKSLPFLEKAIQNTAKNYNPFSSLEARAPIDAFYHLAKSYQLNNQLDKAIEFFNKFREVAGKKHFLNAEVDRAIEMCINAGELLSKPLSIKISNIGSPVNSPAPEYGAIVSLDERALYFTSRRLWKDSSNIEMKERSDGEYFEDIYVSFKDKEGKWMEPELLNFNRADDHEATVFLSGDGQTLYLYRDDDGNGNLYQSFFIDTSWSAPVPMGSDINSKSHETHLTITLDGKTLYFVSSRKGGFGEKDIYKCTKLPNGQWSLAQNLGAAINTIYDEEGPYIHPDGKTLFFSSRGHKSMGGFDVFMSTLKDDGIWSTPENLGYPINTTDDDIFFVQSPDGKRAYYSTFKDDGFGSKDIYIIGQPDAMDHSLTLIKGTISVPQGIALPEDITIIITDNQTGEFITEAKPLRRNGSFVYIIPPGKNYNISYVANGIEFYNENVYVPIGSDYQEVDKMLMLDPSKLGTSDAVSINIISSTEKQKPQWKIRFNEKGIEIPDNSFIQYLNEDGNIIYEERLSKSGFFAYHELEKNRPYMFTLKSKDNPLCLKGEIVLFGHEDSSYKFMPDSNCIFKEFIEQKPRFMYDLFGKDLPRDVAIQYLADNGSIIFEEKMDPKGYFSYRELPNDSNYILKIKSEDVSLCGKGEIVIPGPGGTILTLAPDENCVYRLKEKKLTFVYDVLNKVNPSGLTVQFISDEGSLLEESKLNAKGEFKFRELMMDKPYSIVLKTKDKILCDQSEIIVPGPGGLSYIMVADENCIFRLKEKKSQFVFTNLNKDAVKGLIIQAIDDQGKIIFEQPVDDKGQFAYTRLPANKPYSLRLKAEDSIVFINSEIFIPVVGKTKAFHKFTPDNAGVFRLKETRDDDARIAKLFDPLKSENAAGFLVQILDEEGKIIAEEKPNEKGEFSYEKIPVNRGFSLKIISDKDPIQNKFSNSEIIVPAVGSTFYKLTPDSAGIFKIAVPVDEKLLAKMEKEKEKERKKEEKKEKQIAKEKEITKEKETEEKSPITGEVILEKTAMFDYNSSDISPRYQKELDEAAKTIKENPKLKVEISGHTDSKGMEEFNVILSRKRAENAAKYLTSQGVPRKNIIIKGFGETQPVAPNIHPDGTDNPEGRQKNRRIEIKIKT